MTNVKVYTPPMPLTLGRPDPRILAEMFAITKGSALRYRHLPKKTMAGISDIFTLQPVIVLGFMCVYQKDAVYAIRTGQYPDDIADREEPNLRKTDYIRAWMLDDANSSNLRKKKLAAEQNEAVA